MQTWVRFHGTAIWPPRSRGENEWRHHQTMCCTFRAHLLLHSYSLFWLLSLFSTFWSFLWTGLSLWLHSTKKGMYSQCRLECFCFWPGENKLHHRKACIYKTICFFDRLQWLVCSSFDSGPCMACLVRMRDDVLLLHKWGNNYLMFCSGTRFWIALALGC